METVPCPVNETARVAALRNYQILDTDEEGFFGQIVAEVKLRFHAKIAAIALVDESRQWSKAIVGMPRRSIPRGAGFCSYTIQSNDVLVVEDARVDARFASLPLVKSQPKIRFYAGAPLIDRNGYRIGAICIADSVTRSLSTGHVTVLKSYAERVMRHIELHQLRISHRSGLSNFLLHGADAASSERDQSSAEHFIELAYALWTSGRSATTCRMIQQTVFRRSNTPRIRA